MTKSLNAIDFSFCLLEYYKKLKITEEELAVILMIEHLLSQDNSLITNDLLALRMNYTADHIDEIICSLLKKGYVEYDSGEGQQLATSIQPLKNLIYREFEKSLFASETTLGDPEYQKRVSDLYKEFEVSFKRSLAPVELDRIDEWLRSGISINKISFSLKAAVLKEKRTIKAVDNILNKNLVSKDFDEEGYSLKNSNITDEETKRNIEILKTKWKKDD